MFWKAWLGYLGRKKWLMSRKCLYLLGKFMDCMSITQTFNLDFFPLMHNLRIHIIENILLTEISCISGMSLNCRLNQHSVILDFMLWLEVIWGEEKLKQSYAPVWEDSQPYQITVCCFLLWAFLPKIVLALKGNYFSILESSEVSRAT